MAALSTARDRAANETDFEQAAFLHKRLERMKAAAAVRDEVVAEVHQVQRSGAHASCCAAAVSTVAHGKRSLARTGSHSTLASKSHGPSRSITSFARNSAVSITDARTDGKRIEHLAIFSRWYYSSWRDGQWFPFRTANGPELPQTRAGYLKSGEG